MNRKSLKLIHVLNRIFLKTNAHQIGGELIQEIDDVSDSRMRKSDLVFFSAEEITKSDEVEPVRAFMIIIISESNKVHHINNKINEHFKEGTDSLRSKVVWLIFPHVEEVYVYEGKTMTIQSGLDICSAAPVLPNFEITAVDIFKKPSLP